MNRNSVRLSAPDLGDEEISAVVAVLRSGWLTSGPHNRAFEDEFAQHLGGGHCVSLNSCASALFLALRAQKIRGEVILPSFTFSATANAVETAGAQCVWADIDPITGTLDPRAVESAITPRTEAIVAVHFAGHMADLRALESLARARGLALIEDAAEALGARQGGSRAGSADVGCFSFFATKNLCTGEGGMLSTRDGALADRVRVLASHGIAPRRPTDAPWRRAAVAAGYNFRMAHVAAALGRVQLRRLDAMNEARRAVAGRYASLLDRTFFDPPVERPGHRHVYQLYAVRTRGLHRGSFVAELQRQGIEASVHFDPPVHRQPYYAARYPGPHALRATDVLARCIVSLPMSSTLRDDQIVRVATAANAAAWMNRQSRVRVAAGTR